jgi:serine/threonine protein kinase
MKIDKYEIIKDIGSGGMSNVFLARDTMIDREVALKVMKESIEDDDKYKKRFQREIKAIVALEHESIVPLYDTGEFNGHLYIVMRYMANGSLIHLIQDKFPLENNKIKEIFRRISFALDVVHNCGMIHRDIKPSNILFDKYDAAYLSDFGIVKSLNKQNTTITESTHNGVLQYIGTPAYMSPEQIDGLGIDRRSDIYSLGITLFQVLTGQLPFNSQTPTAIFVAHKTEPVPSILDYRQDLSPDWDFIIQKCTAKKPDARYSTMIDFVKALNEAGDQNSSITISLPHIPSTQSASTKTIERGISSQNVNSVKLINKLKFRDDQISLLAFTPDGQNIISANRNISVWDLDGRLIFDIAKQDNIEQLQFCSLCFTPEGKIVYISDIVGSIYALDITARKLSYEIKLTSKDTTSLHNPVYIACSNNGEVLAAANKYSLYIWKSESFRNPVLHQINNVPGTIKHLSFSPDNKIIAIGRGSPSNKAEIWDANHTELIANFNNPNQEAVSDIAFSPTGNFMAFCDCIGRIYTYKTSNGTFDSNMIFHQEIKAHQGNNPTFIAFSNNGKLLLSGGYDSLNEENVKLWDVSTSKKIAFMPEPEKAIQCVSFSPDGMKFIAGGKDSFIYIWGINE